MLASLLKSGSVKGSLVRGVREGRGEGGERRMIFNGFNGWA